MSATSWEVLDIIGFESHWGYFYWIHCLYFTTDSRCPLLKRWIDRYCKQTGQKPRWQYLLWVSILNISNNIYRYIQITSSFKLVLTKCKRLVNLAFYLNKDYIWVTKLTLKVLNFWKFTSYCSLKPLWSGMGEVVPARTSPTIHPPSPPTVHQLSWLAL